MVAGASRARGLVGTKLSSHNKRIRQLDMSLTYVCLFFFVFLVQQGLYRLALPINARGPPGCRPSLIHSREEAGVRGAMMNSSSEVSITKAFNRQAFVGNNAI